MKFSNYMLDELLGPLNEVEKKHAPKTLYVSGKLPIPLPGPRAAIIGSRKASEKGLEAARYIAKTLVKENVLIVSGLAEGIDTSAHETAVEEGGNTIAVLGTPLNEFYPQKNTSLQELIMHNHLAISQFQIGCPIQRKNFVIRNRLMALISDASIIVEAGNSSGSLHQGWEALRLGRPLFIWHSILENSSITWSSKMRQYGAMILKDPQEVMEVLPTSKRVLKVFS
ncbi:MAG: DNA-processing protein DprA [Candidatus Bathyarchaeum tardum]|nr:MAG: DNA-processing protein DprA [Candidatus Bathyarchaeum tardum]